MQVSSPVAREAVGRHHKTGKLVELVLIAFASASTTHQPISPRAPEKIVPGLWRSYPCRAWKACLMRITPAAAVTAPAICLQGDQPPCQVTGQELHSPSSHDCLCASEIKPAAPSLPNSSLTSSSTQHSTSLDIFPFFYNTYSSTT